jgi:hypothetical protein
MRRGQHLCPRLQPACGIGPLRSPALGLAHRRARRVRQ